MQLYAITGIIELNHLHLITYCAFIN